MARVFFRCSAFEPKQYRFFKLWTVCSFILITFFTNTALAQAENGFVDEIKFETNGTTEDKIIVLGKKLPLGELLVIEPINYPILEEQEKPQWRIRLRNADVSPEFLAQLTNNQGVVPGGTSNIINYITVEVMPVQYNGIVLPTVDLLVYVKKTVYLEQLSKVITNLEVDEQDMLEIKLTQQLSDPNAELFDRKKNIPAESLSEQDTLPVPILRVNIVGFDGASSVINSQATNLAIYLNQQRKDELNQKFGIQFFVNNVTINREKILKQSVIYYRFDENNPKRRFLKEALYLAKLIPSESIIRPMTDQNKKNGVDIEIFVGKNLR